MMHAGVHDFAAQPYILCSTFAVGREEMEGGNGGTTNFNSYPILKVSIVWACACVFI